jgi:SAM-dependent methyltransferase
MVTPEQVAEGQAVYTPLTLAAYDLVVLGLSNRLVWRCPTAQLLRLYDAHVSANHLDVGVGTGYFLDRCRFPGATPRLALMDLNPNSLRHAARRTARYRPESYRCNVLEPLAPGIGGFDSVGLSYLLHCLPGTMADKAVVFDHLRPLLNPGGRVFGATLLADGAARSGVARRLMALYNRKGIFHNTGDTRQALEQALGRRFPAFGIDIVGCAALFWARLRAPASAGSRG